MEPNAFDEVQSEATRNASLQEREQPTSTFSELLAGFSGGRRGAVLGRHWDAGRDRFPGLRDAHLNDTCIWGHWKWKWKAILQRWPGSCLDLIFRRINFTGREKIAGFSESSLPELLCRDVLTVPAQHPPSPTHPRSHPHPQPSAQLGGAWGLTIHSWNLWVRARGRENIITFYTRRDVGKAGGDAVTGISQKSNTPINVKDRWAHQGSTFDIVTVLAFCSIICNTWKQISQTCRNFPKEEQKWIYESVNFGIAVRNWNHLKSSNTDK